MAVNDLNDLFESVDGLAEDLMEYGIMAGAAVASHIAFNAAVNFGMAKFGAQLPAWVGKYAVPGVAIAAGVAAGSLGGRFIGRRAGTGVAVGLMTAGITRLVKEFAPSLPLSGNEVLLGDEDLYAKYLGNATTIEQVNGLGNAMTIESVGDPMIEQVNGFSLGSGGIASAFQ